MHSHSSSSTPALNDYPIYPHPQTPTPPSFFLPLLSLALCFLSFLLTFSTLALLPSPLTCFPSPSASLSFFSSTSTIHSPSPSLFRPLYPHFVTHSPFASSYTILPSPFPFPLSLIPFFFANFSQVVSCFGAGRGFSRGKGVVQSGSVIMTPVEGEEVMGQVVRSWFMSAWAVSRAVEAMRASEGEGGSGLLSVQRRLPRSKV